MVDTKKTIMQRNIEIGNWVVLGVFSIVSFLFMSREFAMGVLLGGLISVVNFRWLSRDLRIVFLKHEDRAKPFIIVKYYIRFILMGVVLFFVITRMSVDVLGLLLGLSVVVINIILTVIGMNLKNPFRRLRKKNASLFIFR
ncbi:MAG: ATP synthase subunit I [Syntrophobacterales bacterium]|nr:ATP synthase subunit I [Syntrophobacterales bacterium]